MAVDIHPITPGFAAEVGDVDLSKGLAGDDLEAVKQAFWTYSVLVFPDQHLTAEQHLAFAQHFGPSEASIGAHMKDIPTRIRAELADVSNLDAEGRMWGREARQRMFQLGNRLWHTDSSFKQLPALASALYARSIAPVGGHTEFADLRAAWDALPDDLKARAQGRIAEHSIFNSRAKLGFTEWTETELKAMPPVLQAVVRTIPQNGRRSLYLASHMGRILGLPDDEARALTDTLVAHATQRQFVYTHRWRVHDLVIWDNRCTMHRGTPFDDLRWARDVQRATVSDVANTLAQEGLQAPQAA